jgi:hypothetical protein
MPTKTPTINRVEEKRESRQHEQMPVHDLTVKALIREAEQVTTPPQNPNINQLIQPGQPLHQDHRGQRLQMG